MKKFSQIARWTSAISIVIALIFGLAANTVRAQSEDADFENVVLHITIKGEVSLSTEELEEYFTTLFEEEGIEVVKEEDRGERTADVYLEVGEDGAAPAEDKDKADDAEKDPEPATKAKSSLKGSASQPVTTPVAMQIKSNNPARPVLIINGLQAAVTAAGPNMAAFAEAARAQGQAIPNIIEAAKAQGQFPTFDARGVKIFEGANSGGRHSVFGRGTFTANNGSLNGIGNDTASSVEVPKKFTVKLCEHEGGSRQGDGNCETFGEGNHNLRFPRSASWVQVVKNGDATDTSAAGVTIFEGEFGGNSAVFGNGIFTADNGPLNGIGNDTASSVEVPKGFTVRLCSDEGDNKQGAGQCEEYGEGRHSLRYKRTASWIKVTQN